MHLWVECPSHPSTWLYLPHQLGIMTSSPQRALHQVTPRTDAPSCASCNVKAPLLHPKSRTSAPRSHAVMPDQKTQTWYDMIYVHLCKYALLKNQKAHNSLWSSWSDLPWGRSKTCGKLPVVHHDNRHFTWELILANHFLLFSVSRSEYFYCNNLLMTFNDLFGYPMLKTWHYPTQRQIGHLST